jgi:hypothetical protein
MYPWDFSEPTQKEITPVWIPRWFKQEDFQSLEIIDDQPYDVSEFGDPSRVTRADGDRELRNGRSDLVYPIWYCHQPKIGIRHSFVSNLKTNNFAKTC